MNRPQLVSEEFLRDYIRPVFSALGLIPITNVSSMRDDLSYITHVVDEKMPDHTLAPEVGDLIFKTLRALREVRSGRKRTEEAGIVPPLSPGVFSDYVLPFFCRIGWQVLYTITENKTVSITGLRIDDGTECDEVIARQLINTNLPEQEHHAAVPYLGFLPDYEKFLQGAQMKNGAVPKSPGPDFMPPNVAEPVAEQAQETAARSPIIDYVEMRRNPTFAKYLEVYALIGLTIENECIIEKVKPDFAAKGWIYSGTHYAKNVGLSLVLNAEDEVVDPRLVVDRLGELGAKFQVNLPLMDDLLDERVNTDAEIQEEAEQDGQEPDAESETDNETNN